MDWILYTLGIILSIILIITGIIYWKKRKQEKTIHNLNVREMHISKIFVKSFTVWLVIFAQFTGIVLFIFCFTMLLV
ncbi:hypothetical protein SSABA_v1c03560 [Spiroplasma sabaudiense Ar-1343]|uniref:Uncharacterized protein n=1 Tax=Spiroplasma sabaudiense Ar-1343 TaxID=1276257 RepID=W6AA99_9MOLU|nr:hypothetical protein [Spiroplasma sabaudiense]AHI53765.1 hypothetical protein SSABA_v1c03560 [Spiroplasma sabaudiense Ar-1343]